MGEIKIYKELSFIETFDGEIIALTEDFTDIMNVLNGDSKFMNLGNQLISKSIIKRVFTKEVDEIDNAMLQIADKNLRSRVQSEVESRRKSGSRLNMEIYKNILDRLSN